MKLGDRQARRMMERMGINMKEMPGVEEVIIRTAEKEIHIRNAAVSEVNAQGNRVFQVVGEVDLRTLDRHPAMSIGGLIPNLSCQRCCPNPPFAKLIGLNPEPAMPAGLSRQKKR